MTTIYSETISRVTVVDKGRDILKGWVCYSPSQDFINIFLLVLCKK